MAATTGEVVATYSTGYNSRENRVCNNYFTSSIISKHDSVLSKLTNLYSHKGKICHDILISDIKFL